MFIESSCAQNILSKRKNEKEKTSRGNSDKAISKTPPSRIKKGQRTVGSTILVSQKNTVLL
jgi:hypothetical protein